MVILFMIEDVAPGLHDFVLDFITDFYFYLIILLKSIEFKDLSGLLLKSHVSTSSCLEVKWYSVVWQFCCRVTV